MICSNKPYLGNYIKKYDDPDREDCIICSNNDIFTYKSWIKLGCSHYFHKHCIDIWLEDKDSCPICKQDVYLTHKNRKDTDEIIIIERRENNVNNMNNVNAVNVVNVVNKYVIALITLAISIVSGTVIFLIVFFKD